MRSLAFSVETSRALADTLTEQAAHLAATAKHAKRLTLWAEDIRAGADYVERALSDPEIGAWDAAWSAVTTGFDDVVRGVQVTFSDGQRHVIAGVGLTQVEILVRGRGMGDPLVQRASFNRVIVNAYSWPSVEAFTAWLDREPVDACDGWLLPDAVKWTSRQDIHKPEWSAEDPKPAGGVAATSGR